MRACHATQGYKGSAGFGQEAEAGVRGKPKAQRLLGFPQEGEGRQSKQFQTGKFE